MKHENLNYEAPSLKLIMIDLEDVVAVSLPIIPQPGAKNNVDVGLNLCDFVDNTFEV